jgi:hypothetical protein
MTGMDLAVEAVAGRKITARRDGKATEITMMQGVLETLGQMAMKGGAHATRQFLELVNKSEEKRRAVVEENIRVWTIYKRTETSRIAAAHAKGEAEPEVLPHPDDVILDGATGVRFDGPLLPEGLKLAHQMQHLIEAVLLQEALNLRRAKVKKHPAVVPGCSLKFAIWCNRTMLGQRMRFTDEKLIDMRMRFRGLSIRTLERLSYQAWQVAGIPTRRSARGLSNKVALQIMQFTTQATAILENKDLNTAETKEETDRLIQRVFG